MAKDPVCGMDVDEVQAVDQSTYQGKMYFFCSAACREQFDQDQARFVPRQAAEQEQRGKWASRRKAAA